MRKPFLSIMIFMKGKNRLFYSTPDNIDNVFNYYWRLSINIPDFNIIKCIFFILKINKKKKKKKKKKASHTIIEFEILNLLSTISTI